jgi:hypothetical protein
VELDADGDERTFVVEHVHQIKKANPGGPAKYATAVQRYNAALGIRSTSLEDLKKLLAAVKVAEKAAYEVEELPVKLKLSADKKLVVRDLAPPVGEDGKPRKLSAAELQKLRGDGRYPGYASNVKALEADRKVRVYFDKAKVKAGAAKDEESVYPVTVLALVPPPAETEDDFKPIPLK